MTANHPPTVPALIEPNLIQRAPACERRGALAAQITNPLVDPLQGASQAVDDQAVDPAVPA